MAPRLADNAMIQAQLLITEAGIATAEAQQLKTSYLLANWEVGHTQYVTSQLLHVRFQPEKVRLVGLGFNKINPVVLWITPSGCRVM